MNRLIAFIDRSERAINAYEKNIKKRKTTLEHWFSFSLALLILSTISIIWSKDFYFLIINAIGYLIITYGITRLVRVSKRNNMFIAEFKRNLKWLKTQQTKSEDEIDLILKEFESRIDALVEANMPMKKTN
jgi:hypothetical protein